MNRRAPLILVQEPDLVSSGLYPDRHPMQTPLWERGVNVRFYAGKVTRRVPNALAFSGTADPVRGISQHQNSDGKRWVWAATGENIYRWWGAAPDHVVSVGSFVENETSTVRPTFFDFVHWGDWTLINSADNGVLRHKDQDDSIAPLPNAPTDAVLFLKKRNQLLAVGHGANHKLVSFSDADDIELWASAPDNTAGELPLEELDTPVRAGCHFGPNVAVFGENQMFSINWVGAPYYFGQTKLLEGIGAIGKQAICADGRVIYGCGRNGLWRTDGMMFEYIDELHIKDYLQRNVNWDQSSKILCFKNDITGCIEFSFPMGAELTLTEGWSYDPRYGGFSQVPPNQSGASRVVLERPLGGTTDGKIEYLEFDDLAAGPLDLRSRGLTVQRDNQAIHVGAIMDEAEVFVHRAKNVAFRVGTSQNPDWDGSDTGWDFTEWMDLNPEQITYQLNWHVSGVYHRIEFKSLEDMWELDLQGFALFGTVDGQKREGN